jgi:alkylhydroperoxidase/carboxymuconolactone decarboxylase family protein YurZ
MGISETAQKNHDELFPGHVSKLKVTDPELIEVFDNFAFDEVLRHSSLDTRTRLMVQLAALIGARAGIGVPVRELLTLAMLAALGGCDPQVRGHVAAVGNSRQDLIDVITVEPGGARTEFRYGSAQVAEPKSYPVVLVAAGKVQQRGRVLRRPPPGQDPGVAARWLMRSPGGSCWGRRGWRQAGWPGWA